MIAKLFSPSDFSSESFDKFHMSEDDEGCLFRSILFAWCNARYSSDLP